MGKENLFLFTKMTNTFMFPTKCARRGCDKKMYVYGKDKVGNVPTVYCSKRCEGEDAYEKRFKK